jgi:hypothetical protein
MIRPHLEAISRLLSEAELIARRLPASAKLIDRLDEAQAATAAQLAKDEPPVALTAEEITRVRRRLIEHCRAAGVGSTMRLLEATGLDAAVLYGFKNGNRGEDWFIETVARYLREIDREAGR